MVRSLHTSQNTHDIPLRFHWSYTVSPRFATFDNYVFLTLGQGLSSEKNVKNLRIHCFFVWKTDLDSSDSSVKTKLWAHDSKQQQEHACHGDGNQYGGRFATGDRQRKLRLFEGRTGVSFFRHVLSAHKLGFVSFVLKWVSILTQDSQPLIKCRSAWFAISCFYAK